MKNTNIFFGFFVSTVLVFTGLFIGCGTLVGKTAGGANFFPHSDGYKWTYELTSSNTTETMSLQLRFDGSSTLFGTIPVQHFKSGTLVLATGQVTNESTTYYRITDSGVYQHGSRFGTSDSPTTEASVGLLFPFDVGTTWNSGTARSPSTVEVVAREDVTVPAGTFDCFKGRTSTATSTSEVWFGNGVGIVKVRNQSTFGSTQIVSTLVLKSKNF